MKIERSILSGLMYSEDFIRKVGPHIEPSLFADRAESIVCEEILGFFEKYNSLPSSDALKINISSRSGINESVFEEAVSIVEQERSTDFKLDWLIDKTEKFCRDRSVYNAIIQSLKIIDGSDKEHTQEAIPTILQKALNVCFDADVGHSYLESAASRYDFYNLKEDKIKFDIDMLNKITNGGIPRKSLTVLLSPSGGGKSLVMTHMAAAALREGLNVLYITMEMAEERIAERIDANLLNVEVSSIKDMGKDAFVTKIDNIAAKSHGRLFIKEYPTGSAHSGHFRALIEELKAKKNFIPDVVYVDYLGICASARVRMTGSINSYQYLKHVAEELRGLATEFNVPLITAGQVNRDAYGSSDFELNSIADSAAIVHTADLILGLIRTEELDAMDQLMIKQLKNRYGDPSTYKRFLVGLNRAKMQLYNLATPSAGLMQDPGKKPSEYVAKLPPKDLVEAAGNDWSVSRGSKDVGGFTF